MMCEMILVTYVVAAVSAPRAMLPLKTSANATQTVPTYPTCWQSVKMLLYLAESLASFLLSA